MKPDDLPQTFTDYVDCSMKLLLSTLSMMAVIGAILGVAIVIAVT